MPGASRSGCGSTQARPEVLDVADGAVALHLQLLAAALQARFSSSRWSLGLRDVPFEARTSASPALRRFDAARRACMFWRLISSPREISTCSRTVCVLLRRAAAATSCKERLERLLDEERLHLVAGSGRARPAAGAVVPFGRRNRGRGRASAGGAESAAVRGRLGRRRAAVERVPAAVLDRRGEDVEPVGALRVEVKEDRPAPEVLRRRAPARRRARPRTAGGPASPTPAWRRRRGGLVEDDPLVLAPEPAEARLQPLADAHEASWAPCRRGRRAPSPALGVG